MFTRPISALCGSHLLTARYFSKETTISAIHPTEPKSEKQDTKVGKNWEKKALNLILGRTDYDQFTDAEKALVNRYQDQILQEAPLVLPNTGLFKELEEVKKILDPSYKR